MKTIEERGNDFALKEIRCKSIEELERWGTEVAKKAFEEIRSDYIRIATEQQAIDNKRKEELLQYLEELEAHYRDLGQYDDGKPIRRVIEYVKSMEW